MSAAPSRFRLSRRNLPQVIVHVPVCPQPSQRELVSSVHPVPDATSERDEKDRETPGQKTLDEKRESELHESTMLDTPIAFLIFNRPDLTQIVFETIARAKPKKLLVVADGPRFPEEREICLQARAIIEQVDWNCEVLTNFSEVNLGCRSRVSSGLDWVFSQVEEAIILEDDCVPHPSFFSFCSQLLDYYRDDERVMMIGGTNYLLDALDIQESYTFSRYFAIWGWATWRRAWEKYDINMAEWEERKSNNQLDSQYSQKFVRRYLTTLFDEVRAGHINTWDVQWSYSCIFNNGLSIVPRTNLVTNIGAVGTHSSKQDRNHGLPVFALDCDNLRHPVSVFADHRYDDVFFKRKIKPAAACSSLHSIRRVVRGAVPSSWRSFIKRSLSRAE